MYFLRCERYLLFGSVMDSACPSRTILLQLTEGTIPDDVISQVADHVDECVSCQNILECLPRDSVTRQIAETLRAGLPTNRVIYEVGCGFGRENLLKKNWKAWF